MCFGYKNFAPRTKINECIRIHLLSAIPSFVVYFNQIVDFYQSTVTCIWRDWLSFQDFRLYDFQHQTTSDNIIFFYRAVRFAAASHFNGASAFFFRLNISDIMCLGVRFVVGSKSVRDAIIIYLMKVQGRKKLYVVLIYEVKRDTTEPDYYFERVLCNL